MAGEPGAGKTAMIREFCHRSQERNADLLVALGDCNAQAGTGDAYLPFREVLDDLTGNVEEELAAGATTEENASRIRSFLGTSARAVFEFGPALVDVFVPGTELATRLGSGVVKRMGWGAGGVTTGPPVAVSEAYKAGQVFEQYTNVLRAMSEERPLLLVLDDLHWADPESTSLLFHLSRRLTSSRILMIGSYRPADVAIGQDGARHPLESVLNEIKRDQGDVWIELDPDPAEGRTMVDALLDREPNKLGEAFREGLLRHSEGNPLFCLEVMKTLRARGDLSRDSDGAWRATKEVDWGGVPARVEGVIAERLGRLNADHIRWLQIAAVEGQDFTADVISRVNGVPVRDVVRMLSQEMDRRHQLVVSTGVQRVGSVRISSFRFTHGLFQTYLYDSLAEPERAFLHEDVGLALEDAYGERAAEVSAALARHFEECEDLERAVGYRATAGHRSRASFANQEAASHYLRALELYAALDSVVTHSPTLPAEDEVREALADVLGQDGRLAEARVQYENLLGAWDPHRELDMARIRRKIGDCWLAQHRLPDAAEAYRQALHVLGEMSDDRGDTWWNEWIELRLAEAWVAYWMATIQEDDVRELASVIESRGTPVQKAFYYGVLASARYRSQRYMLDQDAVDLAQQSLDAARESGLHIEIANRTFGLGFALLWKGERDRAEEILLQASQLADRCGATFQKMLSITYLAVASRLAGNVEQTRARSEESRRVSEQAQNPTYVAVADANLAWVALRNGNIEHADALARSAVTAWEVSPVPYPFEWLARLVLLAVAMAQDDMETAVGAAAGLLKPQQMRLPESMTATIGAACGVLAGLDSSGVRHNLTEALGLARRSGLL